MRMVSNKHVTSMSMKRFKKVHVQHKVYVATPIGKKDKVKEEAPVVEEEKIIIPEPVVDVISGETEIVETPKPRTRKKKAAVVETVENNEEKPENDG